MSSFATAMSIMQKDGSALIKTNTNSMRAICQLTKAFGNTGNQDNETSNDLYGDEFDDEASTPKRSKNNCDDPALARQKGGLRRNA